MILRELGFMVYVELPHKYVPNYVKALGLTNEVTQQAWNFTNDRYANSTISATMNVSLQYKEHHYTLIYKQTRTHCV